MILSGTILAGCGGSKSTGSQSTNQAAPVVKTEAISDIFAKGQKIDGLTYDYVMTASGMTMSGKTWMMGKMMKTESTVGGENIFTYVDSTTNTVTIYNVNQKTATKMTAVQAENQNTVSETPLDYTSGIDQATVKELETVVYDGVKCRVVEVTDKDSKSVTKMWIREDHGIPMRIESTDPTGAKFVMEYKNMKIGSLAPDVFQVPAGVPITDMNEMMNQIQQMPGMTGGQR